MEDSAREDPMNKENSKAQPSRPEFTPDRKPQKLDRNFDRAVLQLEVIASKPTQNQLKQIIETTQPAQILAENSQEFAINTLGNYLSLKQDYDSIAEQVKVARAEALGAKPADFAERKSILTAAIDVRREVKSQLKEAVGFFREIGLQVEPSQFHPDLTPREQVQKGVGVAQHEAGRAARGAGQAVVSGVERTRSGLGKVSRVTVEGGRKVKKTTAEGARATGRGTKGAGEAAGRFVQRGVEATKGAGREAIEAGRRAVIGVVAEARRVIDIEGKKQSIQNEWNTIKGLAEAAKNAAVAAVAAKTEGSRQGIGRFLGGIGEKLGRAKEKTGETLGPALTAVGVFKDKVINSVREQIPTGEDFRKRIAIEREAVGRKLDGFNNSMQEIGKKIGEAKDELGRKIGSFAENQGKRVTEATSKVTNRVKLEVTTVIGKGGIILEGARQAVQDERVKVQERNQVWGEKMGIVVEGVSDVASPIIDRILDKGRDVRDAAMGFGGRQIEGLRKFGRGVASNVGETVSPHWNALAERWEAMRSRSNEARGRLNVLITEKLGPQAARFARLKESVAAKTKRAGEVIAGVTIAGGNILQGGLEAPQNVKEWMVGAGAAAGEFLKRNTEAAGKAVEAVKRYVEVYAVGWWKDRELSDIDVSDRMKLLRGLGAASAERAAKLAARGTAEGIEIANFLTRDSRGRLLLGAAAILIFAVCNSDSITNVLSNSGLPDLSISMPDMSAPGATNLDIGAAPTFPGAEAVAPPLTGTETVISAPEAGLTVGTAPAGVETTINTAPTLAPTETGGIFTPQSPTGGVTEAVAPGPATTTVETQTGFNNGAGIEAAVNTANIPETVWSQIQQGQPISAQLERISTNLPGNPTENYYRLMSEAYNRYVDVDGGFRQVAQAVVDNPSGYRSDQVQTARDQLDAIAQISQNPVDASSSQGYNLLMRAMHFWRPV